MKQRLAFLIILCPNADRVGTDYLFDTVQITSDSKMTLKMASGGGFVVFIK